MPILVGTDGRRKMSKSLGNHIGITESPGRSTARRSASPTRRWRSTTACCSAGTRPPERGAQDRPEPREAKRALARELVSWLHSPEAALAAEREFDRVFVEHRVPESIAEACFQARDGVVHLPGVIAELFGISRTEARRLIDQGAVTLAEEPLVAGEYDVPVERAEGQVLRVGKRRFRRLRAG